MKHIMDEERRSSRVKDSDSSNEKEKKKRKRKRNAKKKKSSDNLRNSFTVSVNLRTVIPHASPLILDGFTSSDTIGVVKARLCERVKELRLRPLEHETGTLSLAGDCPLDENRTLASLFPSGCSHLPIEPIRLFYYEGMVRKESDAHNKEHEMWLSLCKNIRFKEEAHESIWSFFEEDHKHRDPVSISKRPKAVHGPLPFAESDAVQMHGYYELLRYSPFADDSKDVHNNRSSFTVSARSLVSSDELKTTASVILLAPSDEVFKDLVSLNSDFNNLVVRVYWDGISYILLRMVRESYPEIPIVAVTDLDPHHLDLLTFLDTPFDDLPWCYGWDSTLDFGEFHTFDPDIEPVNIKWLGLRDVDCKDLPFDGVSCPPPGFQEVIRMLRVNPFLRRKKKWLAALDWLDVFGRSMALASAHLGNDFIAKKLSEKDWV